MCSTMTREESHYRHNERKTTYEDIIFKIGYDGFFKS